MAWDDLEPKDPEAKGGDEEFDRPDYYCQNRSEPTIRFLTPKPNLSQQDGQDKYYFEVEVLEGIVKDRESGEEEKVKKGKPKIAVMSTSSVYMLGNIKHIAEINDGDLTKAGLVKITLNDSKKTAGRKYYGAEVIES